MNELTLKLPKRYFISLFVINKYILRLPGHTHFVQRHNYCCFEVHMSTHEKMER